MFFTDILRDGAFPAPRTWTDEFRTRMPERPGGLLVAAYAVIYLALTTHDLLNHNGIRRVYFGTDGPADAGL